MSDDVLVQEEEVYLASAVDCVCYNTERRPDVLLYEGAGSRVWICLL
jgi:hypothetical protein